MPTIAEQLPAAPSKGAARFAIAAAATSALFLVGLHALSPEFEVSWRMVSEYANGKYGWLLTAVFIAWAMASWALAMALTPLWATWLGRFALLFLVLAGLGQMMGGLFDLNHPLHGAAFAIGVPSLTLAAVLVTIALRRNGVHISMWPAHLSWISFVLMAVAMAHFISSVNRAGIDVFPSPVRLRNCRRAWRYITAGPTVSSSQLRICG